MGQQLVPQTGGWERWTPYLKQQRMIADLGTACWQATEEEVTGAPGQRWESRNPGRSPMEAPKLSPQEGLVCGQERLCSAGGEQPHLTNEPAFGKRQA